MKLKTLLMAGVAATAMFMSAPAEASDRMHTRDIQNFVTDLNNFVNSPNLGITQDFLTRRISTNAGFRVNVDHRWAGRYYNYRLVNNYYYSPYYNYRYGYAYNPHFQATSLGLLGKGEMIQSVLDKKASIPNFKNLFTIEGTRINADRSAATVDLLVTESGLAYGYGWLHPHYGYGYRAAGYTHSVNHAESRCSMNLQKFYGDVVITGMTCNTVMRAPL